MAKGSADMSGPLFAKRAARFTRLFLANASGDETRTVDAIGAIVAPDEDPENVERVVKVLEMQGLISVETSPEGRKSIRLTPDGVAMANALHNGGK